MSLEISTTTTCKALDFKIVLSNNHKKYENNIYSIAGETEGIHDR